MNSSSLNLNERICRFDIKDLIISREERRPSVEKIISFSELLLIPI